MKRWWSFIVIAMAYLFGVMVGNDWGWQKYLLLPIFAFALWQDRKERLR